MLHQLIILTACLLFCPKLQASFSPFSFPTIPEEEECSESSNTSLSPASKLIDSLANLGNRNILAMFNLLGQCPEIIPIKDEITGELKMVTCPTYTFNPNDQSIQATLQEYCFLTEANEIKPNLKPLLSNINMSYNIEGNHIVTVTLKKPNYRKTQLFFMQQQLIQLSNGFFVPETSFQTILSKLMILAEKWPDGIALLWEKCKNPGNPYTPDQKVALAIAKELSSFGLVDTQGNITPFVTIMLFTLLEKVTFDEIDPTKCSAILNSQQR